jgi:hypothetical protein
MARVYRDSDMRARLTSKAREEYAPIRWDVMKQRYVTLVSGLVEMTERLKTSSVTETQSRGQAL